MQLRSECKAASTVQAVAMTVVRIRAKSDTARLMTDESSKNKRGFSTLFVELV